MTRKQQNQAIEFLKEWVLEFHQCGDKWDCIEIIQDGYAEDDDGEPIEHEPCYAIFINKNSHLIDVFPEHENATVGHVTLVHKRSDDYCAYVWINEETDNIDINTPDADEGCLTWEEAVQIILAIEKRYKNDED